MKAWNQEGQPVEMDSVDVRECVQYCGYTTSAPVGSTDAIAADEQSRLDQIEADRVAELKRIANDQAAAEQEAERARLATQTAEQEAERVRLADAAAEPAASEHTSDRATLTAAELKDELTKRGIEFRANASQATLQALLDAAPAQ